MVEKTLNESLETFIHRMEDDWETARAALTSAPAKCIAQANRHRRDAQFAVGDWVLFRMFPKARVPRASDYHVLSPRFAGPYQVRAVVTPVTYLLDLPPNTAWNTSKVFNASWLRPYHQAPISSNHVPDPDTELVPFDPSLVDTNNLFEPDAEYSPSQEPPLPLIPLNT